MKIEQKSVKTGEVLAKPSIKTKDLPYPWMWHFYFMAGTPHTHVKVSFLLRKIGVFMNLSDAALCRGTDLQKEEKEK